MLGGWNLKLQFARKESQNRKPGIQNRNPEIPCLALSVGKMTRFAISDALSWPAISPHDAHHQIGLSFTYVSVGFVCSWWRKIHHAGRHFGDSMKELGFVGLKMVTRWYGISESSTSDARIISLAWDKAMIIAIYLQIHVCPAYGQLMY